MIIQNNVQRSSHGSRNWSTGVGLQANGSG